MQTSTRTTAVLAHGLVDADGIVHRDVHLHPLTGWQELALGDAGDLPGVVLATQLLAGCVARIGAFSPVEEEHLLALTRGDRQHVLLRVVQELGGSEVPLVVRCPNPSCRALADLDASIPDLLATARPGGPEVEVATDLGQARVREACGHDDLAVLGIADPAERSAALWSRLLLDLAGEPADWSALPARVRHQVALGLAEASTAPDLAMVARCPSCAALLELVLDPLGLLLRQLRRSRPRLLAEVHCIAWTYHWSEQEILALPRGRRWAYLELIGRQAEGRPLPTEWS